MADNPSQESAEGSDQGQRIAARRQCFQHVCHHAQYAAPLSHQTPRAPIRAGSSARHILRARQRREYGRVGVLRVTWKRQVKGQPRVSRSKR